MTNTRFIAALFTLAALSDAGAHPLELQGRPRAGLSGSYVWELELANGMKAHWETSEGTAGAVQAGQSAWFQHGKPLGSRRVELMTSSLGLMATIQRTEEEDNAAYAIRNDTPELDALSEKFNAFLDKMNAECSSLPEVKQAACTAKYEPQVQAMQNKLFAQRDAVEKKANSVSAVCARLDLKVRDGKVNGTASYCGSEREIAVTGTFRSTAAK